MDGWLTTKKTGRDDKAIARDRQRAVQEQRAKRGVKPLKGKAKARTKPQPKKGRSARRTMLDSESESDEWNSEHEESEEEEEEDVILTEEESSDDGCSFLPKSKRKNVKIKPMLEGLKKQKAKHKKNGYAAARQKVTSSSSDDEDSDEESTDIFDKPKRPTAAAARKKKAEIVDVDLDSDSDESLEIVSFNKSKTDTGATSKYFQKNTKAANEWEDEDDTPVKPKAVPQNKAASRKRVIEEDDDDEDFGGSTATPRKSIGDDSWAPEEGEEDGDYRSDDEALQIALRASLKSNKSGGKFKRLRAKKKASGNNNKRKKMTFPKSPDDFLQESDGGVEEMLVDSDEEKAPQYKEDIPSSSDEEEQEDDDEVVVMDEDEREASNVLAAATKLCNSVMTTMASWASEMGDNEEGAANNSINGGKIQGMIVDGALAMTSMRRNIGRSKNDSQHSWISNELMQEVLPNLTLAEYQLIGVNWLAYLHSMTCKVTDTKNAKATNVNGILADEMGLGKTCQTIAFLAWLKHSRRKGGIKEIGDEVVNKGDDVVVDDESEAEDNDEDLEVDSKPSSKNKPANVAMRTGESESEDSLPHLIVMPASVVSNWKREFENFAPHMNVMKFHGTREERDEMKAILRYYMPKSRRKNAPALDVILVPITYFQRESSEDRDFLRRLNFDYLICDEGHLLKNHKGLRYKNLDRFRSKHRLLLTGTPVQNSPQELMALLCFLMPLFKKKNIGFDDEDADDGGEGMLQHFVNLESAKNNHETSHELAYRKLKQLFAPFVLRRRKKDVLSQIIPPKSYEVEFVELVPVARTQYNSIIETHLKAKRDKTKSTTQHLFTTLRKAAHHPHLLRTRYKSPQEAARLAKLFQQYGAFRGEGSTLPKIAEELVGFSDFDIHLMALELIDEFPLRGEQLNPYILTEEDLFASAKLAKLKQMLPKLIREDGHRILIFSVWTSCLDLIGCLLEQMKFRFMRMDGQTDVADRQELIDRFNSDSSFQVFLLSTNACGIGINLTSADVCIMHDISVNPFVDLQAEDRCHRIGQKKPVKIIKLVAKDTVDSDIYDMQERKVKMNAAIMESPSEWSKDEKKVKALIMKNVVERHTEGSAKVGVDVSGKENIVNVGTSDAPIDIEESEI